MIIHIYSDPGHGWAKVKRSLLAKLGILAQTSSCSFQRGDDVFLEDDDDLQRLRKTLIQNGKTVEFREHTTDKQSKIRGYQAFRVQPTSPMKTSKPQPSPEQIAALEAFIARQPTNWRTQLTDAWQAGTDASEPNGHLLRQIRNQFGPAWLATCAVSQNPSYK